MDNIQMRDLEYEQFPPGSPGFQKIPLSPDKDPDLEGQTEPQFTEKDGTRKREVSSAVQQTNGSRAVIDDLGNPHTAVLLILARTQDIVIKVCIQIQKELVLKIKI